MKPGRTSRQSQRDYATLFGLRTPLIARLTFNVRRPHADEARSRFFVYDEPGTFAVFRKSRSAAQREEKERAFWFSRIDRRRSCRQFWRREDRHRSGSKERVGG